jgi:hypothetical protein
MIGRLLEDRIGVGEGADDLALSHDDVERIEVVDLLGVTPCVGVGSDVRT